MKKSYTWEEIKSFLTKELKKTKHIMTFGTIGSCDIKHDIDTIITKKPKSKSSDFYKEIHNLFDILNNYLNKKYNSKVICLPSISYKEELLKLSNFKEKDLVFHLMTYVSYPQIKRDWNWALFENENIKKILLRNYKCLLGSTNDLLNKDFQRKNYYDNIFVFLNLYNRINSHYSEKFLVKVMNDYYDFLFRKILKLTPLIAKNKKDVRKHFYKLCDILDKTKQLKK